MRVAILVCCSADTWHLAGLRNSSLDDERHLLDSASAALRDAGFTGHTYRLSKELLFDLKRERFDLLLIDWMVPDIPGIDVVRSLRTQPGMSLPVLFVTARDAERDVIDALEAGADDYMVKPVRTGEMVWGRGSDVPSRTMDTHVSRVRTKLDLRPEHGFLLAPMYSYGYRLEQLAGQAESAAS